MTDIDRRNVLCTMLGATAVVGTLALTATTAAALPRPQTAPGSGSAVVPPIANAADVSAPPVHQAHWWWRRRRRRVVVVRRRYWW